MYISVGLSVFNTPDHGYFGSIAPLIILKKGIEKKKGHWSKLVGIKFKNTIVEISLSNGIYCSFTARQ